MLKKCLIVIMSSLIALIPVTVCTAASVTEIVADVNIYTVTIRATADAKGDYPLKVYRMVNGEPESEPVYMGQTESAPAIWEKVVGEGENKRVITLYTYTFDPFELDVMSKSGKYLAVVGDSASQEFSFINKQDKIVFYNQISAAAESELNTLLQSGADDGLVDFDLGNYFSYSTKIQTAFNTALASFELPVLSDDASDEEIRFFETLLKEEFARLLAAGDFLSADSTGFDSAVKQATELNLDLKFYDHEKLKLSPAAVHSRMQDVLPYNLENYQVQNTFNFAVLMAMLDTASYGFVTEALDYYNGKCVNLSDKHTKEFDDVDFNNLSSELKKVASNIKNASQLETKYDEIAEKIETEKNKEETGGGSSGGSGGGSSSGRGNSNRNDVSGAVTNDLLPSENTNEVITEAFHDLNTVSWAKEAICYLADKNVLNGRENGLFYPDDLVTREEFVKMITLALHILDDSAETGFTDVECGRWSYPYIASGVAAAIINGVSEQKFAPEAFITRQDMAVIVFRAAQCMKLELSGTAAFSDENEISDYAKNAVSHLAGTGIVNGVGNGLFAPKDAVTRAQAAKIIYELVMANGGMK
ncbi:S-layer homology domain-containing protein [Congzhengia minquanensis]|uniref:S-layer homology domain-containing protein n=1 Tax=Congzhengia minquanensis TaxID=2763657 RepID=A0A926DJ38_9FIRM|nr:S-layer homology domain-containing protein [Congzhengia minquanensis]MBC8539860.1 S-layer homology domain-containing protein [Congzhengia minquanensis]